MPFLPLDYPFPYAATLGVMLFPGVEPEDQHQARTFAARRYMEWLPLISWVDTPLSHEGLTPVIDDVGPVGDVEGRWANGILTGLLLRTLYSLAQTEPALASWSNAMRLTQMLADGGGARSSNSTLYAARSQFGTVAHLWAAWTIRDEVLRSEFRPGTVGQAEFECFLAEAEVFRSWGQTWRHTRAGAEPPLPAEVWRVPEDWSPPACGPWPPTGGVPALEIPAEHIARLRGPGRPRRAD